MAIKLRRGNKADLVVGNLQQGEPVVALDTKEFGIKGREGDMIWQVPENRLIAGIPLQKDISKKELTENLAISHRNLLHNWDFRNPVNQRGQSTYNPSYNYSVDRWISSDTSITVNSASITLTRTGSTNHFFLQRIENSSSLLAQKTLTFSIEIDGMIYSGTGVFPNTGSSVDVYSGSNVILKFSNISVTDCGVVIFIPIQGDSVTITRTKLEFGSLSTLENDPPADYGEQLALCQRYYQVCDIPQVPALWTDAYKATVFFNPPMRATPVIIPKVGNQESGSISLITFSRHGFHWGLKGDSSDPSRVYLAGYIADANL